VKGGAARIIDGARLRNIADFNAPHVSSRRVESNGVRLHAVSA
jgi:hypothetical protein